MSKILTVRSDLLTFIEPDALHQSWVTHSKVNEIIAKYGEYRERSSVEHDPVYRQPIPYVMVRQENQPFFVVVNRETGQTEARLHGKLSIAAGGHVEDGHSITYTALREVTEELGIPISDLNTVGVMIASDKNKQPGACSVEDVHIAIVFLATTRHSVFHSPEVALQNPRWQSLQQIVRLYPQMEKWSQIIIRDYLQPVGLVEAGVLTTI